MEEQSTANFLRRRMVDLREKNGKSISDMAELLYCDKSSLSRAEKIDGPTGYKTVRKFAEQYCDVLGLNEKQKEQFMRGEKIAIPDTSALLKNTQLIDELNAEYDKVIIPTVVVDELDSIKNRSTNQALAKKAWEIIRGIGSGDKTISVEYSGPQNQNNDCKIIFIAREVSSKYSSKVDIITEDTDYSAYLKGDANVSALHLKEYMKQKQTVLNMDRIEYINALILDSYEEIERPSFEEVNGYLRDGNTLIISTVRNKNMTFEERKIKISWLVECGADVNKPELSRRYFPPITHAVQINDYEMLEFLLKDCKANPNVGSRNPHDSGYLRQKNEGNMALMVAAYHGRDAMVRLLCEDERISMNQQDSNGYTALMKACMNGNIRCRDILLEHNADQRIVDINGRTAMDHYNLYLENGPSEKRYDRNNKRRSGNYKKRW